ncbi:MAG: 50S ribosomal protein L32e [Methanobacteriota archaeon]|nr:MAG: 50S ribosomal protein L32e [Euryarchaeota archaeon]
MCKSLGLNHEGKAAELRERLVKYVEIEEEEVEEEEELEVTGEEFVVAVKPKLDKKTKEQLKLRKQIADSRPTFRRQEWFRYSRLGESWRKPRVLHSKMRRGFGYRVNLVSTGYRGPKAVRGFHPSGFQEVMVHRLEDLEDLDPKKQAARIGPAVGSRKREEIEKAADEKGIRILNRSMIHES